MIIGAVTIIVAVLLALAQRDLKKLLAYDAISQAGYMVLGIGTGTAIGIIGGLFHLINTAIFKSCLFFGAGSIEKQTKTTDFDELGGLAKYMPLTFFCMLVAGLSVSGVPPFNGFTSKWLIYQSCIEAKQPIMLIVAMIGSALTLALFIKVIYSVFFGTKPTALPEIKEVSPSMTIPQIVLALLCIFFGVFAVFPVGTFLTPIVNEAAPLSIISSLRWENTLSLWNPSVATILLLIGLVVGVIIYFIGKSFKPRRVATYYGGNKIDDEDVRVPGTGFYETIEKLPILRTMYHDNESGVWDPDYFFSSIIDGVVIRGLKFMHSGNLSTYLSWAIIGLVAIIGALIW
jgi:formate hydrogenlyase subunit 3/multisubunit Na+/H+ antiporter MnhD subunit